MYKQVQQHAHGDGLQELIVVVRENVVVDLDTLIV